MPSHADKLITPPTLRFPEFRGRWTHVRLGDLADLISERAGDNPYTPFTVTTGIGLISQQERYGRTIAGNAFRSYFVLKKNDFAYNKSATKAFPQGYIARFLQDEPGAVPNSIFVCFRANSQSVDPPYLDYLFAGNLHGRWLTRYIEVSARAHGSLSVADRDLMSLPIPLPHGPSTLAEQRKIADCLTSLDELIAAQGRKVEALKAHKKGLMQQLFPREGETLPRLRFPKFRNKPAWQASSLASVGSMKAGQFVSASEIAGVQSSDCFPCYGGNGLRGYTKTFTHAGKYALIGRQGALCGNAFLVDGKFHATEHALVVAPNECIDVGWLYYTLGFLNLNQYSIGQAQPGLSISVLEKVSVAIPTDIHEQQQIADCLGSIDGQIAAESKKLNALKTHKKGLMQQLFPSAEGD